MKGKRNCINIERRIEKATLLENESRKKSKRYKKKIKVIKIKKSHNIMKRRIKKNYVNMECSKIQTY